MIEPKNIEKDDPPNSVAVFESKNESCVFSKIKKFWMEISILVTKLGWIPRNFKILIFKPNLLGRKHGFFHEFTL